MKWVGMLLLAVGLAAGLRVGLDMGDRDAPLTGPIRSEDEAPAPEPGLVGRPAMSTPVARTAAPRPAAMNNVKAPPPLDRSDVVVLEGRVVDPEGVAIRGIRLQVEGTKRTWRRWVESDGSGLFRVTGAPRACFPMIIRPARAWRRLRQARSPIEAVSLADIDAGDIELVFRRFAWIEGEIRDDRGGPIEGARIGEYGARSNAEGLFRVVVEESAKPVTVRVRPPLGSEFLSTTFKSRPGQRRLVVTLHVGAFIEGRVVDSEGAPATGTLTWRSPRRVRVGSPEESQVSPDGTFRVGPVSGEVLLTLTGDLAPCDAVTAHAPAKNVVLVKRKMARVTLRTYGGASAHTHWFPDDSALHIQGHAIPHWNARGRTPEPDDAAASIDLHVPETSAVVWVHDPEAGFALFTWTPAHGQTVDVRLEPGLSISGKVEGGSSGRGFATASHGRFTARGTLDVDGRFVVSGLTEGEWEIRVGIQDLSTRGGTTWSKAVRAEAGRDDVVIHWK